MIEFKCRHCGIELGTKALEFGEIVRYDICNSCKAEGKESSVSLSDAIAFEYGYRVGKAAKKKEAKQ